MNERAPTPETILDDDPFGFADSEDDFFSPEELQPPATLQANVSAVLPVSPSVANETAVSSTSFTITSNGDQPDDAFWSEWNRDDDPAAVPTDSLKIFAAGSEMRLAETSVVEPVSDVCDHPFFTDHDPPDDHPDHAPDDHPFFADDGPPPGSVNERDNIQRLLMESDPISIAAKRLRSVLCSARGKIRVSDAQTLAGYPQSDFYSRGVVGRAMQRLGWHRRRCRLGGKLGYAYAKGTPHERKVTLEIARRGDDHIMVTPTSPSQHRRRRRPA